MKTANAELMVGIANYLHKVDKLIEAATFTISLLETLSSENFSLGGDRPARKKLADALAEFGIHEVNQPTED